MKEEEEKRIANMTRQEFAKLTGSASASALDESEAMDAETDMALDQVDEMDKMVSSRKVSAPASLQPHTAKGERLLRERLEREGVAEEEGAEEGGEGETSSLSPAEKRAKDAERRAAWRKARLKSLENVST